MFGEDKGRLHKTSWSYRGSLVAGTTVLLSLHLEVGATGIIHPFEYLQTENKEEFTCTHSRQKSCHLGGWQISAAINSRKTWCVIFKWGFFNTRQHIFSKLLRMFATKSWGGHRRNAIDRPTGSGVLGAILLKTGFSSVLSAFMHLVTSLALWNMGGTKCPLSPTLQNMGGTCPPVPHPNKVHANRNSYQGTQTSKNLSTWYSLELNKGLQSS